MASEHIAAFAGYDLAQVARSLDVLVGTGVLRRSLNPTHIGRLYRFTIDEGGGWLPPLLRTASTPEGRREVIRLLQPKRSTRGAGPDSSPPEQSPRTKTEGANHA